MNRAGYVVQQNGQVTLPMELREDLSLKRGDAVTFVKKDGDWVVVKREASTTELLDLLGNMLADKGVTMEDILADSPQIREDLFAELYGADVADGD